MFEASHILKIIELAGPYGFLFVMFFLYHRSQSRNQEKQLEHLNNREERNYEQSREYLAVLQQLVAQGSRIETKIESNQFCPITRKGSHQ